MTKEEQIEQLKAERHEHWLKMQEIGNEITKLQLEGYDYTSKYIYMPEHGYMYVTWQNLDTSHNIYSDDRMFFQGFVFNISTSPYRDDFYIMVDSMEEWWISINDFIRYTSEKRIKEYTKEEFKNELKKQIDMFINKWELMLDSCEEDVKNKLNDE